MDHYYESSAIKTKPATSTLTSSGYPTDGSPAAGIPATRPGAAWFDSVTSEIVNAIKGANLIPDKNNQSQLLSAMVKLINKHGCPTGTILTFSGRSIPDGFLLCNGSEVSRTTYAGLFSVIGTLYGNGNGSTTFKLPDLRDRFIEGAGTNAIGTYLEAGLPNITGGVRAVYFKEDENLNNGSFFLGQNGSQHWQGSTYETLYDRYWGFNAGRSHSIYKNNFHTVQPKALNLNYLIKV